MRPLSDAPYKEKSNGSFTLEWIPQWTVAFQQRDRKFSISALMQSTAEKQTAAVSVNEP